jgi:hypothetical protein
VPVELIPRAFVAGVFAAAQPGPPDREKINRIWNELSARQDYRQLNVTADGAQLVGAMPDDQLLIQLPLIQVRSAARMGVQNAADEASVALKTVAKHLGFDQFFNLGIKHVYHSPAPDRDARGFILNRLLGKPDQDMALGSLERGGSFWAGVKYGAEAAGGSVFVLVLEPLLADNEHLFIDLDSQFPGQVDLDLVKERAREAEEYAEHAMRQYLESAGYG